MESYGYKPDTVRTGLITLSCEAVGGQPEIAENACLMFSLASAGIAIHDDIIDKSPYRFKRKILRVRNIGASNNIFGLN